ncbi:uncharacterized protein LOC111381483 [Olea europaea var. sylvestris]|uniref:uncharacterized protein LOC111381483 n=1 Tax=Olea europaea var. sylvestris TaxID=158386 RepID=UPI000C1D208E|nr:uncharacterized protein LOC111381483 [Olea europaea var. sylvestris]
MHEELKQFVRNNIWNLVPRPDDSNVEGVDFDETFAPIARLESIRLLLTVACTLGFKLYQIDVKSAFLNGILQEEVYVKQPKDSLTLTQIYVDDIIFGSPIGSLALKFAECTKQEFEMSMVGELSYFLGLQVKQTDCGLFISQSKYAKDLVKRFGLDSKKHTRTPMSTNVKLGHDPIGKSVDQAVYRSMIGNLLYLTASRPDIAFSFGVCARFQADPKESHLSVVRRIIRYVNGTVDHGILYSRESNLEPVGYFDAD